MSNTMQLSELSASHPACLLLLAAAVVYVHRKLNAKKLPPGPPGHFLVGHAFKVPPNSPWKTFAQWSKQYGDLIYIHIIGRPMIICNTFEVAKELMDKRGANYSDRPPIMAAEMLGWENTMVLLRYNDRWRRQRKIMQKSFDQQASYSFRHLMLSEVEKFVKHISNFEGDPRRRVHRLLAGAISLASYGHEVMSDDDELIVQMERVAQISTTVGTPGQTPVDFFPFLRFVPTWLPGAGYLRKLEAGKALTHTAFVTPVELVKSEIEARTAKESFIAQLLEEFETEKKKDKDLEDDIAALGGILFLAGAETSEATLNTFFLLMTHHPEIVKRAQAELDEVTKETQCLPTFTDKSRLPYIECIVKELYRYNPPVPLGIPHRSMEDDVYQGRTIPAGSMIVGNVKQMMRDERYYPEPDRFLPERFLDLEKTLPADLDRTPADPSKILFGFGRRICPGRFFADDIIWLTIASVLSVFDILPTLDPQNGMEVLSKIEFTSGSISQPMPFTCRFIPRTERFEALVGAHRI